MNMIKTNPSLTAGLHALLSFAGICVGVFLVSVIDKVTFLTVAKDPGMMFMLIACPIIGGISVFIEAREERPAAIA